MRLIYDDGNYLFYIGHERMKDGSGCFREIYNILPRPKTTTEKLAFPKDNDIIGYPNRRYIERIKGVKFPDRYQPSSMGMSETYLSDEWSGRDD